MRRPELGSESETPTYSLRLSAFGRLDFQFDSFAASVAICDLRIELEFHALLLQDLLSLLGDVVVHARPADLTQEFHHGDFGA